MSAVVATEKLISAMALMCFEAMRSTGYEAAPPAWTRAQSTRAADRAR
jgi:hypothetical protein